MVFSSVMRSFTSCAMSLSPVEMITLKPSAAARSAKVPMTSSASTPLLISSGKPMARMTACSGSICDLRSSGIGGRCDL